MFGVRVASSMDVEQEEGGQDHQRRGAHRRRGLGQALALGRLHRPGRRRDRSGSPSSTTPRASATRPPGTSGPTASSPPTPSDGTTSARSDRATTPSRPGESIRFRYRVILHAGDTASAHLPQAYQAYAEPPTLDVEAMIREWRRERGWSRRVETANVTSDQPCPRGIDSSPLAPLCHDLPGLTMPSSGWSCGSTGGIDPLAIEGQRPARGIGPEGRQEAVVVACAPAEAEAAVVERQAGDEDPVDLLGLDLGADRGCGSGMPSEPGARSDSGSSTRYSRSRRAGRSTRGQTRRLPSARTWRRIGPVAISSGKAET